MQRWEYVQLWVEDLTPRMYRLTDGRQWTVNETRMVDVVNLLGGEGWEMCGVQGSSVFFKRPAGG